MNRERRRSGRVFSEHLVAFSCYHRGDKIPFDHSIGKTVNVGEGGVMLYLCKRLRKGTLLDVEIGMGDEVMNAMLEVLKTRKSVSNGGGFLVSTRFVQMNRGVCRKIMRSSDSAH